MHTDEFRTQRINSIIDSMTIGDKDTIEYTEDILMFVLYLQDVTSQFGLGVSSYGVRLRGDNCLMTVKAQENGTPLVAFITSATPRGCMEKFMDLLYQGALKWQRDKYPPS